MTAIEIYFTSSDSVRVQSFIQRMQNKLPGFLKINQFPDSIVHDSYMVERVNHLTGEITAPDVEYLKFAGQGLSDQEMLQLQNANSVLMITFFATSENIIEKQRNITSFIGEVVQSENSFIGDFNTRRYYSASSWKKQRVDAFIGNSMFQEITLHTYREGEFCRIVSLGMGKFCLPDISIKDFACGDQNTFGSLVNAVVATWVNNPTMNIDSTLLIDLQNLTDENVKQYITSGVGEEAEQKAKVKLRLVKPEEGDNLNTQFRIIFNDPTYSTPQEEQNAVLKKIFGSEESLVTIIHDEAILEASERAKAKLPELRELFNKGLEPGYSIYVKAPFITDSGSNEWMWVEVTVWTENIIEGILQNEPDEISGLKSGSIVKVKQQDIFDYILNKPDGSYDGNETGKLMEEMN